MTGGEVATDFHTDVGAVDGAVLEQRRTGLALVVTEVRRIVARTGHELVAVLVVVRTVVQDVDVHRRRGEVAGGDVHNREGHASTLAAAHVVRVSVVHTDVVVVRADEALGWNHHAAPSGPAVGAEAPVVVRVVRVGSAGGHTVDVLPVEAERCGPVVVVGVRTGLSGEVPVDTRGAPAAVEGVANTVGSVVNAVVVAVPLWDTTRATLVGANIANTLVGVARAVRIVSGVTSADVPGVAGVVGQLHAVAVGDEVVLARPVVVVRVSVATGVDRVGAHLEVVAVPDEGREVDVVGLPSPAHASERRGTVDGGEAHATLHVHTDGVVG